MCQSSSKLRVHFLTLTDSVASEHIYGQNLQNALEERGIEVVREWTRADLIHLFEVNLFTRETLKAFNYLKLLRILNSDKPVVISTDDLYFSDDPSLTARPWIYPLNHQTQKWLLQHSDAIIAVSNSVKDAIEPIVPNVDIHVVHHGVSKQYFSKQSKNAEQYVLHVSLASKRKNPNAIKEAAQQLNSRFIVAGGGWSSYLQPESCGDNVEIAGFVAEEELIDLYCHASVFYFPTLHEGFGLPLLEAMATGNAIVTSDVYSVPEVVGDTAVLHDPNDIESHVDSIQSLLNDKELRSKLGRKAKKRAKKFSWTRTARETIDVYESVLSETR